MKRAILILLLALLLSLASTAVYASPVMQEPTGAQEAQEGDGFGLEDAIGTLGLYAALMAVLAIGTEVVIDTTRPVFGLRRKTTTAEALSQVNEWLPGAVKELGLSEDAQSRINTTIKELEKVTKDFGDKATQAQSVIEGEWPNLLKELAVGSVEDVMRYRWDTIANKLTDMGVDPAQAEDVKQGLEDALEKVRSIQVTDLPDQLSLLNIVRKEVAKQRHEIQGPSRKLWRQVRSFLIRVGDLLAGPKYYLLGMEIEGVTIPLPGGKEIQSFPIRPLRHLFYVPAYLEYIWSRFWGKLEIGAAATVEGAIKDLSKSRAAALEDVTSLQEAARSLLDDEAKSKAEEENRIKWLRILSAVVGIVLAASLQIDSLQLLEPVLGGAVDTFRGVPEEATEAQWFDIETVIDNATAGEFDPSLPWVFGSALDTLLGLTPGIVLSGLGAAAGSAFWHDRLDDIRAAKGAVQTVQEVKATVAGTTGQGSA